MTPETVGPLSRPFLIGRLPDTGTHVVVEATPEERSALAADLGLCAIPALTGRLHVKPTRGGVHVSGRVRATIVQTCVVSLEDFETKLDEEVAVEFVELDERRPAATPRVVDEEDDDPPDEIIDGRVDLGSITAEFLALGLDPHPRKPGAVFEGKEAEAPASPFAALAGLKTPDAG